MKTNAFPFIFCLCILSGELRSQVPNLLNYQGRVAVGTVNFDGAGQFKFALVNTTGSTTYWSNNGTSTAGSQPTAAVTLTVSKGLYSVLLGDATLPNMMVVPATVFTNADVRLRVWFNDGTNGFQLLSPDQRIAAVGYAIMAGSVPDGTITSAKIASGAVGSTQLASNLTLTGNVSADNFIATAAEPAAGVFPVLGMVWIRPGTFILGTRTDEPNRSTDEGPQTIVKLTKGFWMGIHEVTQAEYQSVTGSNPSNFTGDLNRPVEFVSWNEAVAYCTSLTNTERSAGRIPANWSYRLPTGAEWEYACRCGARTSRYSFGDDLAVTAVGNYAWHSGNSAGATHAVEQKQPNSWGLMDMHGNVFEWCKDYYGAYPGGSVTDPKALDQEQRV